MGRRGRHIAMVVGVLLTGAPPAGAGPVACGTTLTQSTTLTADLTCAGEGLVIGAAGVVLDLGGRRLTGAGFDAGGAGVRVLAPGATIRNGRITGFRYGLHLDAGADGTLVEGVTADHGGDGAFVASASNRLRRNTIVANAAALLLTGSANSVAGNQLLDNAGGILVAGVDNLITGNAIRGAGGGDDTAVVAFGAGTRVIGNSVSGYGGYSGIGMASTGEVSGNQVFSNRNGIYASGPATISGNVVFSNSDDGIEVAPGVPAVVRDNLVFRNADLGIDAAGAVDAGGNRAFANGNAAQCVGVVCR